MGIQRQLCFLASLLLVIHAGPISQPSDKDEAIAEDYLRNSDNPKDMIDNAGFPPEAKIDPLSESLKEISKFPELDATGILATHELLGNPVRLGCIGRYFVETLELLGGCPRLVRTDMGTENVVVRDIQWYLRRNDDDERALSQFSFMSIIQVC
ncbi:hypothetical protein QQF64_036038 [Cirrhinus molitorella]|uniref:Uncharacterized protein n=1 Tax=Cirrhinus molitorella TaxID=172907 RepID=A0ABR3NIH7_9TELE